MEISSKKIKHSIAVDVRAFSDRPTGIGIYLENLLKEWLKEDGCRFFLFGTRNLKDHYLIRQFEDVGHEFVVLPWSKKIFNFLSVFFNYPSLDKLIPEAQVFFIPNPLFASSPKDGKMVVTFHDLFADQYPFFYDLRMRLWHYLVNKKRMIGRADKVIAISENTAADLKELFKIDEEKIVNISLGVLKDNYESIDLNEDLPEKFLLYLGNVEPRKNILTAIEAFKQIKFYRPGLKLVIAGSAFPQKDIKVYRAILGDDDIINLGYIDEKLKYSLYSQAMITLLPSWYEGFGLPILESFAAGTPVITSVSSSMPAVSGGAALLVNPFNIKDLTFAIGELLKNQLLREDLIAAGKMVADSHSWAKTARLTLRTLKEVSL